MIRIYQIHLGLKWKSSASSALNLPDRVNKMLFAVLPSEKIVPQNLHRAMRSATLNGGKRLRSAYIYALGKSLGASVNALDRIRLLLK